MNALSRLLAVVGASGFLAACGTTSILNGDVTSVPPDESVVVLGVKPTGYTVMLFAGEETARGFKQNPWLGAAINGGSQDGYLVAKAKAGQTLALMIVEPPKGEKLFADSFKVCGDARTLVFEVPRSSVVYLTDIDYMPNNGRLSVRYRTNISAARDYMQARFPRLAGDLKQHDFRVLKSADACGGPFMIIPIYVGR